MRGKRLFGIAGVAVAAVMLGACAARHAETDAGPQATVAAASQQRAPQDPDLAAVMERFYQQVQGAHWAFADYMISPVFRGVLGPDGVRGRYQDLADLDVTLQQTEALTVVASLSAKDRANPAHRLRFVETTRLLWDGDQWTIDSIARRDLSPGTP
jgi:hypothetical protein